MNVGMPDSGLAEQRLRQAAEEIRRNIQAGRDRAVEAAVADWPEVLEDPDRALDLIYCEIDEREALGDAPKPGEYCDRFPHLADRIERLFEVHEAFRKAGELLSGSNLPESGGGPNARAESSGIEGGHSHRRALGQYQLVEEIGSGATGVVFKATQLRLNRLVAIKILRPFGTDESRERFVTEARLTACLKHPHIVQLHEVGHEDSIDYMSMELLEGGSLATQLNKTTFSPRAAAELVRTLADAIRAAHEEGIVHRDLKPGNVLLTADGTPRISDFGLARHLADSGRRQTRTGAILGTPGYMAPEQASGSGEVGRPADIYSLGAILYELLTGRPPYHGTTLVEILSQMRAVDPASVRHLRSGVPRDLDTICMKCLERSPDQRYESAANLYEELTRFLEGQVIRARPRTPLEKFGRWAVRHKTTATLSLILVAAVIFAAAGITSQWLRAEVNLSQAKLARIRAQGTEQQEQRQRLLAESRLYRQQIQTVSREIQAGSLTAARDLLLECDESRRGWEWRYLSITGSSSPTAALPGTTLKSQPSPSVRMAGLLPLQVARTLILSHGRRFCGERQTARSSGSTPGQDRACRWPFLPTARVCCWEEPDQERCTMSRAVP